MVYPLREKPVRGTGPEDRYPGGQLLTGSSAPENLATIYRGWKSSKRWNS